MKPLEESDFHGFSRAISAAVADFTPDAHSVRPGQDTDSTYTFADIAKLLDINESTLRRRWWAEKLEPAYGHCPHPLRCQIRISRSGNPVYAFTEFGLQVFREYKAANDQGLGDQYLEGVRCQYPPLLEEVIQPEVVDETERHGSLVVLRQSTTMTQFNDLLAQWQTDLEADQESVLSTLSDLEADLTALDDLEEQMAFQRGIQKELRLQQIEMRGRAKVREQLLSQRLETMGKPQDG